MATSNSVWGIDVGQCALKALKCSIDSDGKTLVAEAFDFIEYPKLLSQPEADPYQLVSDAMDQFLSRNDVKGDKIAMSVAGQNGLARFFKPPPVDAKKIPDIVKYEARQQIPFALEDVIWDYQRIGGAVDVDGFALDTEIGLFAMKREQVFKALQPFEEKGIELEVIQLAPLSIYNFVMHTILSDGPTPETYDPSNPPEMMVILSLGTDTTDLVITNGFKVWQRNIPVGGNHFTKQLTKDLKLTFAKAEHLKRNARQAEDAKAIFQAMRPVFNDLLTEVQRSIGFFQNIERDAKIRGMVMLGNASKLPGIQQYLAKNLEFEMINVDSVAWATKISGSQVLSSPQFKDNMSAFGVCYGLCLQGLGLGKLSTNLLPQEIVTQRLIREKKPWVVAGVGTMLLACSFNYFFAYNVWNKVRDEYSVEDVSWQQATGQAEQLKSLSDSYQGKHSEQKAQLDKLIEIGEEVSGNSDRRLLWMEIMKAINESLPSTPGIQPDKVPSPAEMPLNQRDELHIEYVESQHFGDLAAWFNEAVKLKYQETTRQLNGDQAPAADANATTDPSTDAGAGEPESPVEAGYVVEVSGYHFHNDKASPNSQGSQHVIQTLVKQLREGSVMLPPAPGQPPEAFTMKEIGIDFVVLTDSSPINWSNKISNPKYERPDSSGAATGASDPFGIEAPAEAEDAPEEEVSNEPQFFAAPRHDFKVQFVWKEKPMALRLDEKAKRLAEEQAAAAALAAEQGEESPDDTGDDTDAAGGNP